MEELYAFLPRSACHCFPGEHAVPPTRAGALLGEGSAVSAPVRSAPVSSRVRFFPGPRQRELDAALDRIAEARPGWWDDSSPLG
ncbi:hypothetical protein SAMN04487905_103234 [Actinopolyspora xinjiangensis]|uniref:Uncharacterized protein n=1 Tax=Actinopolyspora xinjiangensis TaxID=405564 RepID=A0A1H0RU17_9ACTN|nr:hypothetical protein SAMN04487905_103234 [Actinopolyspora xinjiangensis]